MDELLVMLAPQLRALDELAACDGHLTKAALALGVPQSSMSRRIRALESALGIPLLVHGGRTVSLTPRARELAARMRGPLRELGGALTDAVTEVDAERGAVRFGFPLTMGSGAIPEILAAFRRRHPGVRLQLRQAHGQSLIGDLAAGELDLAVVIPPPERLPHRVVGTQTLCVVVPDDHRFARRRRIPFTALRNETFIANPTSYHLRSMTEELCRAAGFEPRIAIEITEFSSIVELITRGLGIALLPRGMAGPGCVEIAPAEPIDREIAVVIGVAGMTVVTKTLREFLLSSIEQTPL